MSNRQMRWRAGVRLRVVYTSQLPHERLQAALSSIPFASVTLHDDLAQLPSETASMVVSALTSTASTLTALHGLLLGAVEQARPQPGLTAFTRLRALTLHQEFEAAQPLRAWRS